jgi:hypothetical protein
MWFVVPILEGFTGPVATFRTRSGKKAACRNNFGGRCPTAHVPRRLTLIGRSGYASIPTISGAPILGGPFREARMKLGSVLDSSWKPAAALAVAQAIGLCVATGAMGAEDGPRNLSCSFKEGAAWTYDAGQFQSKASNPLSFSVGDIDLEKQTATIKATPDAKPGKLSVVRAINANHFIEAVNEGFLNLTTVYDKDGTTGKYPAVHSRHGGVLGSPVFGQYTGFCTDE